MSTERGILTGFLLLIFFSTSAQQDSTRSRIRSFASLHMGALFADAGAPYPSVALSAGVAVDRMSVSIGASYDVYHVWETLAVFVGIGWDAVRFRNATFLAQVNGGYAKAWHSTEAEILSPGGYLVHPIVGYRLRHGRLEVYMSAGYKFQRLEYEQRARWWGGWGPEQVTVVQDMERVSVQLGIGIR